MYIFLLFCTFYGKIFTKMYIFRIKTLVLYQKTNKNVRFAMKNKKKYG